MHGLCNVFTMDVCVCSCVCVGVYMCVWVCICVCVPTPLSKDNTSKLLFGEQLVSMVMHHY